MSDSRMRVGLEIHQQLRSSRKLFCRCTYTETDECDVKFSRTLRSTAGEMGQHDRAAKFEDAKLQTIAYIADSKSTCLLERDEKPPIHLDDHAKKTALLIASALHSEIYPELFTMRKIVIDGSNTSGFQRTMMVSTGGELDADGIPVGVLGVYLEEDAARLVSDSPRTYNLDRLGVPLVEIALAPVATNGAGARKVALSLGRMLRMTRSVRRGLGSIRQDVNVSVMDGAVVEVKGVQQLDQLEKVVTYEEQRQMALVELAARSEIKDMPEITDKDVSDVSDMLAGTESKIIKDAQKRGESILCIRARGISGMLGLEPRAGMRLGRELGQVVRFFGVKGVFHSDELPAYGITQDTVNAIRTQLGLDDKDAFVIVAAPPDKANHVTSMIISRINAAKNGVPAETRVAAPDGSTAYLRPRPGASRMYPETDVPPIRLTSKELDDARDLIPLPWSESVAMLQKKHTLNAQLAEQMMDSNYLETFERVSAYDNIEGNFAASALLSTIMSLRRKGNDKPLPDTEIDAAFGMLSRSEITKESIDIIFEQIMSGKVHTAKECAESLRGMSDVELDGILTKIVNDNRDIITRQGDHAMGMLMGKAMKQLRGRVPGEKISGALSRIIASAVNESK